MPVPFPTVLWLACACKNLGYPSCVGCCCSAICTCVCWSGAGSDKPSTIKHIETNKTQKRQNNVRRLVTFPQSRRLSPRGPPAVKGCCKTLYKTRYTHSTRCKLGRFHTRDSYSVSVVRLGAVGSTACPLPSSSIIFEAAWLASSHCSTSSVLVFKASTNLVGSMTLVNGSAIITSVSIHLTMSVN